ncbi:MAG: Na+/H+ antiporter NhaA [Propionicimonas sp.]
MTTTPPSLRDRLARFVTRESTGGILLLIAAGVALILANSPLQGFYADLSLFRVGPATLHLDLPLSAWAADGLLAVFFFVVGVELKHELFAGSLRQPKQAAVPVVAAIGGMIVPALLFVVLLFWLGDPAALHGWAIPTATDIAFALAVLAIFGRGLPRALRTFLLTLAVVDDLLAIIVIAAFYTASIHPLSLFASLAAVALFGLLVRLRTPRWWLLIPVGAVAWGFMHASGIHATIAGVALGFTVPPFPIHGEAHPRTHRLDDAVRPFSAGFRAAGVRLLRRRGDGGRRRGFGVRPAGAVRRADRPGGRQADRRARHHRAGHPVHPVPATRLDRAAGSTADRPAVRHRVHRLAADHRAVVHRRQPPRRRQGRHPGRQPARGPPGCRFAALGRPQVT